MKPRPQTAWVAVRRARPEQFIFTFGLHHRRRTCLAEIVSAALDHVLKPARVHLTPATRAKKGKSK